MFQPKSFRQIPSKSLLALAVTAAVSSNSNAGNDAHPFSYEADDNCYCTEFVAISDIAKTITPTPIGGQTLTQVCERLGTGPGLILEDGKYNHPAYTDAQCGNGPVAGNVDAECTLLNANGDAVCGTTGPKWNIAEAYAKPADSAIALGTAAQLENLAASKPEPATQNTASAAETKAQPTMTVQSTTATLATVINNGQEFTAIAGDVQSVANQLRAFNQSVTGDQIAAGRVASDKEKITIVESSFVAEPPAVLPVAPSTPTIKPASEIYSIRDAEPVANKIGVSNTIIKDGSGIDMTIGNQEPALGAAITMEAANTMGAAKNIGPDTKARALTQEEILLLPELETSPSPTSISRQSGDIRISSDDSQLEYRQIIIIEPDGTARRMTQNEIARLPLIESVTVEGIEQTESASLENAQIPTPVTEETLIAPADTTVQSAVDEMVLETEAPQAAAAVSAPATEIWRSSLDYQYIGLAPTGYDFGGGGVEVEASASNDRGFALTGSAGVADEYTEASLGISIYFAPFAHRTTDLVLNTGVETGVFDLGIIDMEDTGGYVGGYVRTRPFSRLELTGGGRYSSYFEGDAVFIASGTFRITNKFNAFSKVEVGDNDQFSFGLRYFY